MLIHAYTQHPKSENTPLGSPAARVPSSKLTASLALSLSLQVLVCRNSRAQSQLSQPSLTPVSCIFSFSSNSLPQTMSISRYNSMMAQDSQELCL